MNVAPWMGSCAIAVNLLALSSLAQTAQDAPDGMRAVAAQTFAAGDAATARSVQLPPYFIDTQAVTSTQFAACVKAGACTAGARGVGADAVRVDWPRAERYCAYVGKRLASDAEWEAAQVAGGVSAGAHEWTNTWFTTAQLCPAPSAPIASASQVQWFPPAMCGQADVLDACDGAVLCGTLGQRVTKDPAAPRMRKGEPSFDDAASASFRCASSTRALTRFPSIVKSVARPTPPALTAPSAAELAAFHSVVADTLEVPPCDKPGRSFADCRDPRSYLKSNEPKIGVLAEYVTNMGGGYTGVGSDQNYTFIALAHAQWAWLFDYDANVVRWHWVLFALIADSDTPDRLLALFDGEHLSDGEALIRARYASHAQLNDLVKLYRSSAVRLGAHYRQQRHDATLKLTSWLGDDVRYRYIHTMVKLGRIDAWQGNMLDTHAMRTIGDAAAALKVPMRVYYPSNAPEFWVFTPQYRDNVAHLPFDDGAIVVQTISGIGLKSGFGQTGYWHYNVQDAREHVSLLRKPGYTRLKQLLWHRTKTDSTELTTCGLPEAAR